MKYLGLLNIFIRKFVDLRLKENREEVRGNNVWVNGLRSFLWDYS